MRCFPFFHDYGPWADILRSSRGAVLVQERRCTQCNKAQRRQTQWLGGDFGAQKEEKQG